MDDYFHLWYELEELHCVLGVAAHCSLDLYVSVHHKYCAVAVNSLNMDIYTIFELCNFQVNLH